MKLVFTQLQETAPNMMELPVHLLGAECKTRIIFIPISAPAPASLSLSHSSSMQAAREALIFFLLFIFLLAAAK